MKGRSGPFISLLTAPGRGAIIVVRVWGDGALEVADRAFRANPGRPLADSRAGRLRVGRAGSGTGDEVVAVVIAGKPPEVEIQCHGGSAAVGLVVEALETKGCRVRSPRAWARASIGSTIRGEAMIALASASTVRAAEILFDQVEGALDKEIRRLLDSDLESFASRLDSLIERARIGLRLVEGWRLVLAGRPNVGKSRLMNALAGFDRAIVAPSPGTTRDVVTAVSAFDGWPVEIADTAGLRTTIDPIEADGVQRALARQRRADLVLVVLDRSEPLEVQDRALLIEQPGALIVANKADLPGRWEEATLGALLVSAQTGDGIDRLIGAVAAKLVPAVPAAGSGVPFRPAHFHRLALIRSHLRTGRVDRVRRSLERWIG